MGRGLMGFQAFQRFSLEEYIMREAAPDAPWIFMHIPKTAGSSFSHELSEFRRPYSNIHVDYADENVPYDVKLDRAVDNFIFEARASSIRAASGHLTMRHILRIKQGLPEARVLTILRNPVQRVISDYRYARTPAHPPHREFIREFPTLDSYVASPASQNKMFEFLTPDPTIGIPELFAFIDEFFVFIGLTEMYPMTFNIATRLFGIDRLPTSHLRKTEPEDGNVDPDPDLVARVRAANAKDVAIYKWVKDRMALRHHEWKASKHIQRVNLTP